MSDFISTILSSPYNPVNIRQRSRRTKAYVALATICFFWGTTWVASREGAQYMPPLQLSGIRQFVAGTVYVLFFLFNRKVVWPKGKEWFTILILSFLNFVCSNGLATYGVKYVSAGLGSIIAAISPLWLVIIGLFNQNNKLPRKAILGFLIGFAGICFIFFDHLHNFLNANFRFGIILSLIASFTWALGTIYTKEHAKRFNPYFGIGLQMILSGIVLYTTSGLSGLSVPLHSIPWQAWTAITYLVIFGSIISFVAFLYALQHLGTEQTSLYAYLNPIVALLLGAMLFGEEMNTFIIVGGLITLYGIYLVNSALRKLK